ncbi:hypothetical protein EMCRGX_G022951 [Ephydatia muelleri]
MGSITHPGHISLTWLPSNEQQKGIDQLIVETKYDKALFFFSTSPCPGLNAEDKPSNELQRYLNEPEIDHLSGDPLAWWVAHEYAYPHVAALPQKCLAIPGLHTTFRTCVLNCKDS